MKILVKGAEVIDDGDGVNTFLRFWTDIDGIRFGDELNFNRTTRFIRYFSN